MSDNRITKKITAPTLAECKAKLYDLYGTDYEIISKKQDFKGGFFGLFQKEVVTVEYMEKLRTEKEPLRQGGLLPSAWEESKKAIIDSVRNSVPSGDSFIQMARLSKQMENLEKNLTESINEVKQAASSRDEHPNVGKIRRLLETMMLQGIRLLL